MRVLFITQNLPYPTNSGSRIRTANLIKVLSLDNQVHSLFLPFRGMDIEAFKTSCPPELDYSVIQPSKRTLLVRGYEYFTAPLFRRLDVLGCLKHSVEQFKPDAVWLDYLFLGQYISWFDRQGIPVVYGTHNAQSSLTRQQAIGEKTVSGMVKFFIMARIHVFHERKYFPRARHVVCVSNQDRESHAKFVDSDRLVVVPNFVDVESYNLIPPYVCKYSYICFVGSIDNFQNAQGIKYFISQIWDKILAVVDIQLLIIGRGASRDKELQSLIACHNNIQTIEDVESVVPFIKGSLVSVVPLLQGSGTRLKIVESMSCKSAIVSTSLGAEGIEAVKGKDILIADEPDEFADHVIRVVKDAKLRNKLGDNAYKFASKNFGFDAARGRIQRILAGYTLK